MTAVLAPTGPFPAEVLVGARSALFLFGAAFLGANDAIHARAAGVPGTVVDRDPERLEQMRRLYPDTWTFVCRDAFEFVYCEGFSWRWDVVSCDPFTGIAADRCLSLLPDIAGLARRALTLTIPHALPAQSLDGWEATTMKRTRLADWLVLTR